MSEHTPRIAVFPGTFDPVTNGHLDVIQRGRGLFDRLVIAVGQNPEKTSLFTQAERAELIRELVADMPNVQVAMFQGLTVDYARQIGAAAILRGIRNSSDLQFEFQVALTNRVVAGVETLFIMTSEQYAFTSSSLIKQVAGMGGDVSALVPPNVVRRMHEKQAAPAGRAARRAVARVAIAVRFAACRPGERSGRPRKGTLLCFVILSSRYWPVASSAPPQSPRPLARPIGRRASPPERRYARPFKRP